MKQPDAEAPLLETRGLSRSFGGVHALSDVSCAVAAGQVFAVIGPNGAGKTTFFNCLTGVTRPSRGEVLFEGRPVQGLAPHRIAGRGLARSWQTIRLFERMSVLDNVLVGRHPRSGAGFLACMLGLPHQRREERRMREAALEQLEKFGLAGQANSPVGALPFLEQRRVELARALIAEPRLLLLDEPAAGLNTRETAELGESILGIRDEGVTVLLVEHDMSLVMEISDRVLVLDQGRRLAEDLPRAIQENPEVIRVYLGMDEDGD